MLVNDKVEVEVQSVMPIQVNEKESKKDVSKNKIKYVALAVFGAVSIAAVYYGRNYLHNKEFDSCSNQCKEKYETFLKSYGKKIEQSNEAVKNAKDDNERTIAATERSQLRINAVIGLNINKKEYDVCTSECIANYNRV